MLSTEGIQLLICVAGVYVRPNRDEVGPRGVFVERRSLLADQLACFVRAEVRATAQRAPWE